MTRDVFVVFSLVYHMQSQSTVHREKMGEFKKIRRFRRARSFLLISFALTSCGEMGGFLQLGWLLLLLFNATMTNAGSWIQGLQLRKQ